MREFRKKIALVLAIVFILSTCNIQNNVYANDEDNDELVTETLHNNTMDSLEAYETEDSDDKMTDVLSSQFDQQRKYTAASNKYLAVSNAAVNKIYSVLLSGTKTEVDVSGYGLTTSNIEDAWILALNEDRILYNTYYSDLTINYLHYTDGRVTAIRLDYKESQASFLNRYQQLKGIVDEIINDVPYGLNEAEKVLNIHDYLVNNCEYDYINYENDSLPDKSFTAYGVLVDRIGVCAGYGQAFCILMDRLGIDSQYVVSGELEHAWNMVKLSGAWYHVDATFDDPIYDDPTDDYMGKVSHEFFLKTDAEMKSDEHSSWESGYPSCTSTKYSKIAAHAIGSQIVYVNNNWYYLYDGKLYQGNPFSEYLGTLILSNSTPFNTLGAYKNILYASDNKNIYKILGTTKTACLSQTSDSFKEVCVGSNGIIYYNTVNNNSVRQYKIPSIISYQTHVENIGWQKSVSDGALSGTQGKGLRLEGIKINLNNSVVSGSVTYKTHVQDYGWMNAVSNGAMSGTTGKAKRLEAIQISLNGDAASKYDIYYRVHVQDFGWLGWAKNGQSSGTAGYGKRLEAIQIMMVPKGASAPGSTSNYFYDSAKDPNVIYSSHVQDYGWQGYAKNGGLSGTSGQGKRLEGIKINLNNNSLGGGITYQTHVQDYGWMNYVNNGAMSGTSGQCKRLEAIRIKLTGNVATQYDVYYRVHAQDFGWLGWAKNGEPSGTAGYAKRLEAIEIKLVRKGDTAPGSTYNSFISK